jgi:hypothetical protein
LRSALNCLTTRFNVFTGTTSGITASQSGKN